jgi:hypothetical protein
MLKIEAPYKKSKERSKGSYKESFVTVLNIFYFVDSNYWY